MTEVGAISANGCKLTAHYYTLANGWSCTHVARSTVRTLSAMIDALSLGTALLAKAAPCVKGTHACSQPWVIGRSDVLEVSQLSWASIRRPRSDWVMQNEASRKSSFLART